VELLRLELRRPVLEDVARERVLRETEPLLPDLEDGRVLLFDRDFPDELWLADCRLPLPCTGTAAFPEEMPTYLTGEPERTGPVLDLPCLAPER